VSLAILPRLSSIQVAWHTSLLLGAGMGIVLVLRWLWWRITAWAELATLVASSVLAPVLLLTMPPEREALRLLCMALGATAAGVATALFGPSEPSARLEEFYRRARPPGLWGPVAQACGESPRDDVRRLAKGLTATVLAAWTVLASLTGLGTWLVGSPAPPWMPWRGVWIAFLISSAVAVAPVWWRLGVPGLAPREG
jgi:hypothetical protein